MDWIELICREGGPIKIPPPCCSDCPIQYSPHLLRVRVKVKCTDTVVPADTKNVDDLRVPQAMPQEAAFDDKYARLIDWNVDVLLHHSARVISCRSRSPARGSLVNHSSEVALLPSAVNEWRCRPLTRMPLDFEEFAHMFPCCNRLEQICMSTSRE